MDIYPDVSGIGRLLGDPSRASILVSLVDGRARSAGELSTIAGISPQAASLHLSKLVSGGLLAVVPSGRHRYYRIASPEVAEALEALARLAPSPPVRSLRASTRLTALRFARCCYDHLAGVVGVALTDALVDRGWLLHVDDDIILTPGGREGLRSLGINPDVGPSRRPLTRSCLDWSERRPHLSGALGAALLAELMDRGWIQRTEVPRKLSLTESGREGLKETFGLDLHDDA